MKRILSVLATLLLAGCGLQAPIGTSRVKVQLTDAPASEASSLVVAFGRVELIPAGEGGSPVTIAEEGGSVDVLQLRNGGLELLGDLEIPAGTYAQIRLIVDAAEIAFEDGTSYEVTVPSGARTGLKINLQPPLAAEAGATNQIILDFDAERAVVETPPGSGIYLLKPTGIRAVSASGTVRGTVVGEAEGAPIEAATVDVYDQGGTLVSSTVTEADGSFAFIALLEGSYDLQFGAEGYEGARAEDVAVTPGETTDLGEIGLTPSAATP